MALNVVFHGDSITDGNSATTPFSEIVAASLGITEIQEGYGSYTTNQDGGSGKLLPNFAAHVHTHFSAGDDNIVVFQESTNSYYFGQTVAQEKADLIQYATTARANGWKVVILNIMQRGNEGLITLEQWRSRIAEQNTWMETHWNSFAHGYADINGVSEYSSTPFEGVGNAAFYADEAHPNDSGHALMAPVIEEAVRRAAAVDNAHEVTLADTTKRIVTLSGTQVQTIYSDSTPYTYTLSGGSPVRINTPSELVGYVSGT